MKTLKALLIFSTDFQKKNEISKNIIFIRLRYSYIDFYWLQFKYSKKQF